MRFSDRYGYTNVRDTIQIDSVDDALKNTLWSILSLHIWDKVLSHYGLSGNHEVQLLCQRLWFSYYKLPLDTLGDDWWKIHTYLRKYFFECRWFEIYNFLEFVADNFPFDVEKFIAACNHALKREMSAYRFVDGKITGITAEEEIAEIENAIESGTKPVQTHLRRALELLSDRKNPDYRNSIKESISAIESLVQDVLGQRGTLGKLIKKMESEIGMHPALAKAFDNLYGYTSDEEGIRHAILESASVDFEDAKFILVACSAFANFVTAKMKR